jgi:hypothetical protein
MSAICSIRPSSPRIRFEPRLQVGNEPFHFDRGEYFAALGRSAAHGVAHVGHIGRRDGLDELDADIAADAREQSRAAAEHHRRDREREFVDEPGA